tara:strand:+ start:225 stop:902 length:678 start_codon:yes stop_codon:yes gene_type:complete
MPIITPPPLQDAIQEETSITPPWQAWTKSVYTVANTVAQSGTTANRPPAKFVGQQYFDTTLTKPVFYSGSAWIQISGSSVGTVTDMSVVTANGISGTVATGSTTPAVTLALGAITPTTIVATGAISGTNLSGTNTGDQTTITGNAGTATKATNLAAGLGGQVPYQSAANTTAMLANGSVGQVLTSAGTTVAPYWSTILANSGSGGELDMGNRLTGSSYFDGGNRV